MWSPVELVSDFILQPIAEWLLGRLPIRVQIGCLILIGIGLAVGLLWYFLK